MNTDYGNSINGINNQKSSLASLFKRNSRSAIKTTLRWTLLLANVLIISDAIFLLIKEKDLYEGEFAQGRHPVSKFLLIMVHVDIESLSMILTGTLGIVGTKKKSLPMLALYAAIMAVTGALTFPDWDAALVEMGLSIVACVYLLILKQKTNTIKYNEIITIA